MGRGAQQADRRDLRCLPIFARQPNRLGLAGLPANVAGATQANHAPRYGVHELAPKCF